MSRNSGRIPSLDGFRAVSILMVLYGHLSGTRGFPPLETNRWVGDLAHLGVIIFFVISGFLITSLLMSEREKTGSVSLKKFYLRRVLRIFPAFYTLILALIVAWRFGWIDLNTTDIAYSLTYTVNYYPGRSWSIGHLWSLSVEEQFYILWPAVFLLLRGRRALYAALVAFLAGPLVRAAMHMYFASDSPWRDLEIFPAMADNIAIGCILALLRPWLLTRPWYLRLTSTYWIGLAVPMILLINRLLGYTVVDVFGSPVMLTCIAVLIEASTRHANSIPGRILNWSPVVFVGVLSYSLYLWQQPFLDRHSHAVLNAFPQNLVLAFVAALLSYFVVEKSFLGLRRRLERTTSLPAHTSSISGKPHEHHERVEDDPNRT